MKSYLLRNDDEQHEERLFLESHYGKRRGKKVAYCDILHELQAEKVRNLRRAGKLAG